MNINKIKGKIQIKDLKYNDLEDWLQWHSGCENQLELFKFIPYPILETDPDEILYFYFTKVDDRDMVSGWIVNSNQIP